MFIFLSSIIIFKGRIFLEVPKGFSLLLKKRMEKFTEAFRDEIAGISPEDFEGQAEAIEEGAAFLIAYGSLKDYP